MRRLSKKTSHHDSRARRLWRAWRKVGLAVGEFVSRAVTALGVGVVQLIMRTGRKHTSATGWVPARDSAVSVSSFTSSRYTPSAAVRLRGFVLTIICVAALDVAAGTATSSEYVIPLRERLESAPSVRPGDIEYDVQRDAEHMFLYPRVQGRWSLTDTATETINWSDAAGRRTTNAGTESTTAVRVAVVGGSGAFGFGQADHETLASRLSEEVRQDGYDVHVSNYGVMGYTAWQAGEDVAYRAALGERFDVVVAYVGFNDVALGYFQRRVPESVISAVETPKSGVLSWIGNHSMTARILGREPDLRKPVIRRNLSIDNHGATDSTGDAGSDLKQNALYNLEKGYAKLLEASLKYDFELVFVLQPNWFESNLSTVDEKAADVDLFSRDMISSSWSAVRQAFSHNMRHVTGFVDAGGSLDGETCWLDIAHTRGKCSGALVDAVKPAVEAVLLQRGKP